MSKVSGLTIVMIFLAATPALAQKARGNDEQSTQVRTSESTGASSTNIKQVDAANQMDQARLAMIAGDYIAAETHIKNAAATMP